MTFMPFWTSTIKNAPSTTFSTRPMPPRSETPAMTQAAIDSNPIVPPRFVSPLSTRAVKRIPASEASSEQATYAKKSVVMVLMPERCAAFILPPTA